MRNGGKRSCVTYPPLPIVRHRQVGQRPSSLPSPSGLSSVLSEVPRVCVDWLPSFTVFARRQSRRSTLAAVIECSTWMWLKRLLDMDVFVVAFADDDRTRWAPVNVERQLRVSPPEHSEKAEWLLGATFLPVRLRGPRMRPTFARSSRGSGFTARGCFTVALVLRAALPLARRELCWLVRLAMAARSRWPTFALPCINDDHGAADDGEGWLKTAAELA